MVCSGRMRDSKTSVFDFQLADGRILSCLFELSARAKRVLLKYSPERGLRMAWPETRKPDDGEVLTILERLRPWIENQVAKAQKRAEESGANGLGDSGCRSSKNGKNKLPDSIHLVAVGEVWPVVYEIVKTDKITLEVRKANLELAGKSAYKPREDHLAVRGPDQQFFPHILQQWLLRVAKHHLPVETVRLAAQYGFKINRVTVKRQKTRWGSCSGKSNINLNYRLMLLRPDLVRLVIMHEFCHLKHMNHGEEFYRLLASYCPDWKELNKELRRAERALPAWSMDEPDA